MKLSIIIPNYNGEELLRNNLPKVLSAVKEYKDDIEIILADDASTDSSVQVIKEFNSSIKKGHIVGKLVENTDARQRGFSKNVNRGVKVATGEILLLLNSDVVPYKGFLDPLLKHFANEKVFAVGCMDESIEDGKTVLRGRGIGKWERGFLLHSAGSLDKTNTLWVSGGSGAFRKSLWHKLGGLNELYNPFYWEDIDVCYRAQKAGYTVLFEKESVVVHEHSKGAIKTQYKSFHIQKTVYRNQFTFVWSNITDASLLVSHVAWLPYHVLNALRSGDKALLVGFWEALLRLPQILQYKKKMKRVFRVKDRAILADFMD